MLRKIGFSLGAVLAVAALTVPAKAFTIGAAKWPMSVVTFYANPTNLDTDAQSAEAAIVAALGSWGSQSNATFQYVYGGRVNDTTTGNDGRNVMLFRNASNGAAIATTYNWWSGSTLLDADTIFWDGAFQFIGNAPCSGGGVYIQDVATHELGHALGLGHSTAGDATMYPSYSGCSQEMRTLAADDIVGIESIYPPSTRSNTPPSVTISSPVNGGSYGTSLTLSGSASDDQDGNLSSAITWNSSLLGYLGAGSSVASTLPLGLQTISASVTDSAGATSSTTVTITVANLQAPPLTPSLTVRAYKVKGVRRADLKWSNLTGVVNITRNGSLLKSVTNVSAYTDPIGGKTAGTFQYRVCDPTGLVCSNTATATF